MIYIYRPEKLKSDLENAEADALAEKYGKIARQVYESVMGRYS